MTDIKPLKQYIFVKIDKTHADTITSEGGLELMLIMGWEPGDDMWHVRESGEVIAGPISLYKEFETTMDVLPGDKVYFHFHVVCEDNRIEVDGQEYYLCQYDLAYLVIRDGNIIMLNNYILAKPKMEEQEDCFSPSGIQLRSDIDPIPVKNRAIVTHVPDYESENNKMREEVLGVITHKDGGICVDIETLNEDQDIDIVKIREGLLKGKAVGFLSEEKSKEFEKRYKHDSGFSIGDEIHYAPESDIPFKVEGEIYYRMKVEDVWGKIEAGKLKPLQDQILVRPKEDAKKSPAGVILPLVATRRKYGEGEVVKASSSKNGDPMTVKEGDKIFYGKGIPIIIDKNNLHWVREDDVMGIAG